MTRLSKCAAAIAMLGISISMTALSGCSSAPQADQKSELASFKGGPMPPEARAKMQAAMDAAKSRSQTNHAPTQ